jgi:hypothetical protein
MRRAKLKIEKCYWQAQRGMGMFHKKKSSSNQHGKLASILLFFYFGFCGMLIDFDHILDCSKLTWSCLASGRTLKTWHHFPGAVGWLVICLGIGIVLVFLFNHSLRPVNRQTVGNRRPSWKHQPVGGLTMVTPEPKFKPVRGLLKLSKNTSPPPI